MARSTCSARWRPAVPLADGFDRSLDHYGVCWCRRLQRPRQQGCIPLQTPKRGRGEGGGKFAVFPKGDTGAADCEPVIRGLDALPARRVCGAGNREFPVF